MPTLPPFDPAALVDMLERFYQPPSGANFQHARAEHPEYFGEGVIFGTKGDKLRLPDGREFDCIQAAGGPPAGRRWQCVPVDPNAPADVDPFALEPGPLDYVDETVTLGPLGGPSFESIAAGILEPLNGADAALDGQHAAVLAFDVGAALADGSEDSLDDAAAAHSEIRAAFDSDNPIDVIEATQNHGEEISAGQQDYVEPPVEEQPVPDPGDRPDPPGHTPRPAPS